MILPGLLKASCLVIVEQAQEIKIDQLAFHGPVGAPQTEEIAFRIPVIETDPLP